MEKKLIIFTTFFLFLCLFTTAQDSIALRYSNYLDSADIKKHLVVLASDSLEGRETAQPGMKKASSYVAGQFSSFGLSSRNNSYYQNVPLLNYSKVTAHLKVEEKILKQGIDYFIADGPSDLEVTAEEVIFAGYGIADSLSGWNDYDKLAVDQKIVMIIDGEPTNRKGNSLITKSKTSSAWKSGRADKIKLANSKNVKAIFFVSDDFLKNMERYNRRLENGRLELDSKENAQKIPLVYISYETANALIAREKITLTSYKKSISKRKKSVSVVVPAAVKLTISIHKTSCTNVLGFIEGTDLNDEVVVISAHLDHLGIRGDKIYYGADDDGSGIASILAMAEIFAEARREGKGLRRSLLFIAFTGEEKGLLGSEYYVSNPMFPLAKTVANLNIDMIGRVDTVQRTSQNYTYIIGSDKLSTQLHAINETANTACCKLELDYKYNDPSDKMKLYYRSDHYNFAKNNVPVIFYFTGLHHDYHKPTDTIDKIDFKKTAGIARLVFNTAWELADRKERITVDVINDFK